MKKILLTLILVLGCSEPGAREPTQQSVPETPGPAGSSFNADSAWVYLARQVEMGPRVPGTPAHRACAEWLAATLEAAGGGVVRDSFSYTDHEGRTWPLENILARFGPEGGGRLLLIAHWDTRPWADQDPVPENRETPIPGANDGASGVAVLLEVARHLGSRDLPRGVDILLVDGEDLGRSGFPEEYCMGSRHFARRDLRAYRRGVVVDLVGDSDLHIPVEGYSRVRAPEVVDWVWERGVRLSPEAFSWNEGRVVYDDHIPFLDAGLPTVDIIDFDYAAWHTLADDLSAVSRRSLASVGRVVLSLALEP